MQIDETITPVAEVRRLDQAPYREDGVFLTAGSTTAAVALQNSCIEFGNNGSILAASGYTFVVDWLVLGNPNAAFIQLNTFIKLGVLGGLAGQITEYPARGANLSDLVSTSLITAGIANNVGTANSQGSYVVPAGGSLYVPLELLLRPTMALQVVTVTQNVILQATVGGRVFRDLP